MISITIFVIIVLLKLMDLTCLKERSESVHSWANILWHTVFRLFVLMLVVNFNFPVCCESFYAYLPDQTILLFMSSFFPFLFLL